MTGSMVGRAAVLALAALALAGCASAGGSAPAGADGSTPPASGQPTAAENQAEAQSEAARLAAGVLVPPGAVEVTTPPAGLEASVMGTPQTSDLVDTTRFLTVPMSVADAQAWLEENPQPGMTVVGTGSSGGPSGPEIHGFQYVPGDTWSWGTANLQVTVAPEDSTAAIRVDGVARWIDPTPTRDTSPGPTVRVTIAAGCPPSDRDRRDVSNPDATDLDDRLVPEQAPTSALTCTYDGMNGHPNSLTASRDLDATEATTLADHLRGLSLGGWGDGARSCPMDDARATVVVLGYEGRADVDVWQRTSGCSSSDNGHIVAAGT